MRRGIGRFKITQGTPQAARNLPAMIQKVRLKKLDR